MRIYLAGPMRGIADLNFPAFHRAAKHLRSLGHEVFNPAEANGIGTDIRDCMGVDLAWICAHAEAVALLPGWDQSRGALAEYHTARAISIPALRLNTHGGFC